MHEPALASVTFSFEDSSPSLDLLPIAARRALDHSGLRLSLEGWRSLSLDDRLGIAIAGGEDPVDAGKVVAIAARATPLPQAMEAVGDPDPGAPPGTLLRALGPARTIDPRTWARLRALDRYALSLSHRRALARNDPSRLALAFDTIVRHMPSGPFAPLDPRISSIPPSSEDPPSIDTRPPSGFMPHAANAEASASFGSARSVSASGIAPPVPDDGAFSTHLTAAGEVRMVDVAAKSPSARRAVATGSVTMDRQTVARVERRDTPKGEVLASARIAGIMAAKRTSELIPLCHPVALTSITIQFEVDTVNPSIHVTAVAEAIDRTGVEMEALVAVTAACLTIYDMLKGLDREMTMSDIKLLEKSGGRSGHFRRVPL